MANHVPNEALAALDEFGRGHLAGRPSRVAEQLRSDLWLVVEPPTGDPRCRGGTAVCRFLTRHTRQPATIRARGSFVETIVDHVDERLVAWGIEPPPAYEYVSTDENRHRYAGQLRLP